jgi:hypothetical protein
MDQGRGQYCKSGSFCGPCEPPKLLSVLFQLTKLEK